MIRRRPSADFHHAAAPLASAAVVIETFDAELWASEIRKLLADSVRQHRQIAAGRPGTLRAIEAALKSEVGTFANARLWDYRPLQVTLDQLHRRAERLQAEDQDRVEVEVVRVAERRRVHEHST